VIPVIIFKDAFAPKLVISLLSVFNIINLNAVFIKSQQRS
jgi:hypothetical protein